jgi:hypothetical protein
MGASKTLVCVRKALVAFSLGNLVDRSWETKWTADSFGELSGRPVFVYSKNLTRHYAPQS